MRYFDYAFFKTMSFSNDDALLIDANCYTDILTDLSDSGFSQHFTPCCSRQTILQKGMLGTIDGLKVYTDSFSAVRFLPRRTVFRAKESDIIRWLENCKMDMDCKPVFDYLD